jgi:hypothetical protein
MMCYSLSGARLLELGEGLSFIREITIGNNFWCLGRFLPFSYILEVLGVVLPYHDG